MTFDRLNTLQDQVAVITGGTGKIGYATAIRLAEKRARIVVLVRRNLDQAQAMMDALPNPELNHFAILASVADTTALESAAQQVRDRCGRCDILVNNAGVSKTIRTKELDEYTDTFVDAMLTINLRSVFSTIRVFLPLLKQSHEGMIVNIGSGSALRPGHGSNMAYTAAKAGIETLTKNLALRLAPNIRVISICPSSVNTGFLDNPDEFYIKAAEQTPLKRIAVPDDIASVVEACATIMRFVTGNCFVVDGGRIL
jgi:short-subunit dehydrogenase